MDRREFLARFLTGAGCYAVAASLTGCATVPSAASTPGRFRFPQGIASGDPTPASVVLWTRVEAVDGSQAPVRLTCEVALDPAFQRIIALRSVEATAATDHTVRVLVIDLPADRRFHYRFRAGGDTSPLGRTRTAPAPDADRPVRLAWASCQSFEAGFYGAWRLLIAEDQRASEDEQLDLVVHVGDFIYEKLGYGGARKFRDSMPEGSRLEPEAPPFATSLADYRWLYKRYLEDPDLQAARARWPFVSTWDDHEFTNDCWQSMSTYEKGGRPAQRRKVAANRAWFEFMPALLTGHPGASGVPSEAHDFQAASVADADLGSFDASGFSREPGNVAAIGSLTIYRNFRWGRNVELIVTDARSYRSAPPVPAPIAEKLGGEPGYLVPLDLVRICDAGRTAFGGNPPAEIPLGEARVPNLRRDSPPGSILGERQKAWWKSVVSSSDARWKLWANSLPVIPLRIDFGSVDPKAATCVFTTDTWEGYLTERAELLRFLREKGIGGLVSLSGDHHSFYAGRLSPDFDAASPQWTGVEFVGAGIASPSIFHALASYLKPDHPMRALVTFERPSPARTTLVENLNTTFLWGARAAVAAARSGGDSGAARQARDPAHNRHLAYADTAAYGISRISVDSREARAELITIARPVSPSGPEGAPVLRRATFRVPLWSGSEDARLEGPGFDGPPPFPVGPADVAATTPAIDEGPASELARAFSRLA